MLNPSALSGALRVCISEDIDSVLLFTREGILVCSVGEGSAKATAAIMATAWVDYELNAPSEGELGLLLVVGSSGHVATCALSVFCLSVVGSGSPGRLVETLRKLSQSLCPIFSSLQLYKEEDPVN